jgi:hypothetical protein
MKLHRMVPALFFFAIGVSLCGHAQPPEIEPLLKAASQALDHYEQLAPGILCQNVQEKEFRNACTAARETLGERVQEAKAEIARYRQRPRPQAVDLFDAYESFRRVFAVLEDVSYVDPDSYGEQNKRLFAEAYNSFVKVTAWFGGVVKASIQDGKCPDH